MYLKLGIDLVSFFLVATCAPTQSDKQLDGFETAASWEKIVSVETVEIQTEAVSGKTEKALKMDFNFTVGTGFCGIQKKIPLEPPDNFQFTFYLKGDAPVNNLEFKLLDESGENVWWYNQRNFTLPKDWRKIVVKKRQIQFAWGATQDKSLKKIDKIKFFIASRNGGKGNIWLDDFRFETLAASDTDPPEPRATVSSVQDGFPGSNIFDKDLSTAWQSAPNDSSVEVIIDLQKNYEYGGLVIDWDAKKFAQKYELLASRDKKNWEPIYLVDAGKGGCAYLPLKDGGSRYLKLALRQSAESNIFSINEIGTKDFSFSETVDAMYREIAVDQRHGLFPRYFYNQQSYWIINGVNNDRDEALINEDGMVEVDKGRFFIEPFIFTDGKLLTWNDVQTSQSLLDDYLPIPAVTWKRNDLQLQTQIFSDGPACESILYLRYTLSKLGKKPASGNLYLALRPFQVNPPWQFLNEPGGTAKIKTIHFQDNRIQVDDDKTIFVLTGADDFGAAVFDQGDISGFLEQDRLPPDVQVKDRLDLASGALKYSYSLKPGRQKTVFLAVPFHHSTKYLVPEERVARRLKVVQKFWQDKLNTVEFHLPKSADRLINTLHSNLAYILINRDGFGIQPGSRSYERSWIRDGALTSSALLKMGVQHEVQDFVNWYSSFQYANGKVPCVVDARGPDPTVENDSNGEFIFALLQYYRFSGDRDFLHKHYPQVQKAIAYMDNLRASRSANQYRSGNPTERACYGLLPESISHEGYSAKPMHSYWDDFFALKGYKDAVQIAEILGEKNDVQLFSAARDSFKTHLYKSIEKTMTNHQINYIPGCVELGDFNATSTAIAIYPVNEWNNLPQPQAQNTFDRYFKYFQQRRDNQIDWHDYTPYEVRLIGTFIHLGQPERARQLIEFFFTDQRPAGWNHWAEVVREGYRTPGFIGDMPHTWVGSDFISAMRSMFVYEDELNQSLVIGAGLYKEWTDSPRGMAVKNMPTYYGVLNYHIKKQNNNYQVELSGSINLPKGNLELINFRDSKPERVAVKGKNTSMFDDKRIVINQFPAKVLIQY